MSARQVLSTLRPNSTPEISVAVSTHNRVRSLTRLLTALARQTLDPVRFEVVVVDDWSDVETRMLLTDFAQETRLQVLGLRVEQRGGPAAARNLAWQACRAEYIAFTDDDCVPTPHWLEAYLRVFGEAVTGEPRR